MKIQQCHLLSVLEGNCLMLCSTSSTDCELKDFCSMDNNLISLIDCCLLYGQRSCMVIQSLKLNLAVETKDLSQPYVTSYPFEQY